jgi:RNA polymerase sigma-70 factor (ECF subfamily)
VTLRAEQAGPQVAGAEALEHFRPGLELLALRALGSLDAAREAVQETLARAIVALQNGQPSDLAKLPAFVAGIARHVSVDMLRAQRRVVSLDTLSEDHQHSREADALSALVSDAERVRVRGALSQLTQPDRELLQLCYYEGLTPGEIATRLGEPSERVRKRKSRALERLRAVFHGMMSHETSSGTTENRGGASHKPGTADL